MRDLPMTSKLKRLKRNLFIDFFRVLDYFGNALMVCFTAILENYADAERTVSISKALFYIRLCVGFSFVVRKLVSGYSFNNEYDKQLRTKEERRV